LVCAAFRADADRWAAVRREAAVCACRDNAARETVLRFSRAISIVRFCGIVALHKSLVVIWVNACERGIVRVSLTAREA
jgi:hypothetical protein